MFPFLSRVILYGLLEWFGGLLFFVGGSPRSFTYWYSSKSAFSRLVTFSRPFFFRSGIWEASLAEFFSFFAPHGPPTAGQYD